MTLHRDIKQGRVISAGPALENGLQPLRVSLDNGSDPMSAVNYVELYGQLSAGKQVWLNLTAVTLDLGTSVGAIVCGTGEAPPAPAPGPGHIMKLRYTPWQFSVLSVEEPASPHHDRFDASASLDGTPVLISTLHSQLPVICRLFHRLNPQRRIVFVMTSGGALPLAVSRWLPVLKEDGVLDGTVTSGDTFGGDVESVNVFSALIAARQVLEADLIVTGFGPGIVGTGTAFGTTAVQQGQVVDAVNTLGGTAFPVLRLSEADDRRRHRPVSHHTLTALGRVAQSRAYVAVPDDPALRESMSRSGGLAELKRHHLLWIPLEELRSLASITEGVKSMGRDYSDDSLYFHGVMAPVLAVEGMDQEEALIEKRLNQHGIYSGRIIQVHRDKVRLPDGRTSEREVVEHPGAAAVVAVDDTKRVVLVRQYRYPVQEALWEVPAGKIDEGEDPLAAAQRELREETGLVSASWTELTSFYTSPGFASERLTVYLAREAVASGEGGDPDGDEFIQKRWLPLEEAAGWCRDGRIADAKTITGLLLAERRLDSTG